MLRRQGIQTTLHGFRASFRTWCGDSGQPRELAEAALAHMIPNATEAAYARGTMLRAGATAHARLGGVPGCPRFMKALATHPACKDLDSVAIRNLPQEAGVDQTARVRSGLTVLGQSYGFLMKT